MACSLFICLLKDVQYVQFVHLRGVFKLCGDALLVYETSFPKQLDIELDRIGCWDVTEKVM